MRCLVEKGLDITPQNIIAYKRRAMDKFLITRADGIRTGGPEDALLWDIATKTAFRKKREDR